LPPTIPLVGSSPSLPPSRPPYLVLCRGLQGMKIKVGCTAEQDFEFLRVEEV